eukprot:m.3858 g.3858  ORF g.3858 m.3858 type:complete len:378 (+) comp9879_c0_seq1:64-1197(+)
MGAFLDKPNTEKHVESGVVDSDIRFALAAMQGWRVEMEDAHSAITKVEGHDKWSFFAVFDGHAGPKCALYSSKNLIQHILKKVEQEKAESDVETLKEAISDGFLALDEEIRTNSSEDTSGTTAVGVLITDTHIIFANCGDSRGILSSRADNVRFATVDHKPFVQTEKERIEKAGGNVVLQRVNGSLAVSRALGDLAYKKGENLKATEQLVSPLPDVDANERQEGDEFVVLACDGVWDVMNNEAVAAFVRRRLRVTDNLQKIGCDLIETCLHKGSRDNMSVIIITFKDAPGISQDEVEKEKKVWEAGEEVVRNKIQEMVNVNELEALDDLYVMQQLCKELPEEYELSSRKDFVVATLERAKSHKYEEELHKRNASMQQ